MRLGHPQKGCVATPMARIGYRLNYRLFLSAAPAEPRPTRNSTIPHVGQTGLTSLAIVTSGNSEGGTRRPMGFSSGRHAPVLK